MWKEKSKTLKGGDGEKSAEFGRKAQGSLTENGSEDGFRVDWMGGHPRREGGAKPPRKATETESKRGGSGATVQGKNQENQDKEMKGDEVM